MEKKMAIKTFKGTNKCWVVVEVFWGFLCCFRPAVSKHTPFSHQLQKYHPGQGWGAGGGLLSPYSRLPWIKPWVDPTIWFYLLTYLAVSDLSWYMEGRIFHLCWGMPTLSCSMWELVPWLGIKPWTLLWDQGVLATWPPGKSLQSVF